MVIEPPNKKTKAIPTQANTESSGVHKASSIPQKTSSTANVSTKATSNISRNPPRQRSPESVRRSVRKPAAQPPPPISESGTNNQRSTPSTSAFTSRSSAPGYARTRSSSISSTNHQRAIASTSKVSASASVLSSASSNVQVAIVPNPPVQNTTSIAAPSRHLESSPAPDADNVPMKCEQWEETRKKATGKDLPYQPTALMMKVEGKTIYS
jgi:hypothetical protein